MLYRRHDTPARPVPVPRIDPAHIRTVAEQAYHDVLACDDRCQVEPGFATPIADVLARLACSQGISHRDLGVRAEMRARSIEQGMLKDRLIHRNTHLLDMMVEESEVDPACLEPLPASLRKGDRLAPEQVEALANGIRLGEIASEVEERLRENGIDLPQDHVDRRAVALAITRAKLRALNDVARREEGAPVETPMRPARPASPEAAASTAVPRLSEMHERWVKAMRPLPKQVDDNARYLRLFIGLHGDLPVDQVTGAHVRAFRDGLLDCPRNAPKRLARATIPELVAWARANASRPKLRRGTIKDKALSAISVLLEQARLDELVRSTRSRVRHH